MNSCFAFRKYGYSTPSPTTSHPVTTLPYSSSPLPGLHAGKSISDRKFVPAPIPLATLRVTMESSSTAANQDDDHQQLIQTDSISRVSEDSTKATEDSTKLNDDETNRVESITPNDSDDTVESEGFSEKIEETTSVEQRLRKISEEIEKYSSNDNTENHGRQSFFSLSDLIKTLHPSDKKIIPQIDSDYSNTMHVLGETASIVNGDDARKIKTFDFRQKNRAL